MIHEYIFIPFSESVCESRREKSLMFKVSENWY